MKNSVSFHIVSIFLLPGYLFSALNNFPSEKISDVCPKYLYVNNSHAGAFNSFEKFHTQMPSEALSVCTCLDTRCNFKSAIFSRHSRTYRGLQIRTESAKSVNDRMVINNHSFGIKPLFSLVAGPWKNKPPDGCHCLRI